MATSSISKILDLLAQKEAWKEYIIRTMGIIIRLHVNKLLPVQMAQSLFAEVRRLAQFSAVGKGRLPQAPWSSLFQLVCLLPMVHQLRRPISTPWTTNSMLASL